MYTYILCILLCSYILNAIQIEVEIRMVIYRYGNTYSLLFPKYEHEF